MSMMSYFALGFIIGTGLGVLLVAWVCVILDEEEHGPIDL